MRLEEDDLQFLSHFAVSPDGRRLAQLLQRELDALHEGLCTLDGAALHRQQGHALRLLILLKQVTGKSGQVAVRGKPSLAREASRFATPDGALA